MEKKLPLICCFTGHREIVPQHVKPLAALLDRTLSTLSASGVTTYRTGGAIGFDTMAALKVLERRESNPEIRLELILPCRDQNAGWADFNQSAYRYILEHADHVRFLHDRYQKGCMFERNRALVESSHFCIGYCTDDKGGSLYTLRYARSRDCRIINLAELL